MKNPYLIQRLQKPFEVKNELAATIGEMFSFGGGLKNGGLSEEAMKHLRKIWRYDYMGSSEFEWGAVPKSMQHVAENISQYVTGEIDVVGKYNSWSDKKKLEAKAKIFFVCKKQDEKEVCEWIHKFADGLKYDYHTKESVNLSGAICGNKFYKDLGGWHDIENHYLFFIDKTMFDKFCELFGIAQNVKN